MFYDKFEALCREHGYTPSGACVAMGRSKNLAAYKGLSPAAKKAFWSRVLTKIVPIPETGEFLLLYTNGNITSDILRYVHK